ncbi:hypothetical protein B0H13DRAFT_1862940 [Mycena leptocephala]|nr:hypothetical protein B0H13DRAFT_1862940 [Mycena leptocephala]
MKPDNRRAEIEKAPKQEWKLMGTLSRSGQPKGSNGNSVLNWTKVMECRLEATLEFISNGVHRLTGSSTILRPWDPWTLLKVYGRESEFDFDLGHLPGKILEGR